MTGVPIEYFELPTKNTVPDLLILAGTKAINDDQSFVSHEAADRMCENASLYFPRVQ